MPLFGGLPLSETFAAIASASPSEIPPAGISFPRRRRSQAAGVSRCPSIDPYFRYGVVALHQGCAQLDRSFLLHRKLKTQSPAAGRRVRLSDDISDFGF